jgi:hypothetical protein
MVSADKEFNPDFHDANIVWIGYCDGMSFAGNLSIPLENAHGGQPSPKLHFRGRANLDAVLDSLIESRGLAQATKVVFAGDSAGALAVWLNLDHVAARLRAAAPQAMVAGFADSGIFQDYARFNSTVPVKPYGCITALGCNGSYTGQMKNIWKIANPATNAACSAKWYTTTEGWRCFMAQHISEFVETPIFDAEAMSDAWMTPNILALGCDWRGRKFPGST